MQHCPRMPSNLSPNARRRAKADMRDEDRTAKIAQPPTSHSSNAVHTYAAQAGQVAPSAAVKRKSAFKIEVRFLGGLNATQEDAFKRAARRWSNVIVGDLPSVVI